MIVKEQQVAGFDVSMINPLTVKEVESLSRLVRKFVNRRKVIPRRP
jgi:hypothetical protein